MKAPFCPEVGVVPAKDLTEIGSLFHGILPTMPLNPENYTNNLLDGPLPRKSFTTPRRQRLFRRDYPLAGDRRRRSQDELMRRFTSLSVSERRWVVLTQIGETLKKKLWSPCRFLGYWTEIY